MKTQRQRLIFLGACVLFLVVGYEGIQHDGWGIFGEISGGELHPSPQLARTGYSSSVAERLPMAARVPQPALPIWAQTSICSRDRLDAILKSVGSDVPGKELILLPHSGPLAGDVIDPTLPSGKLFPASQQLGPHGTRLIFVVPVREGEAPVHDFDTGSLLPMPGHAGVLYSPEDIAFRRTGHFLLMGGTPETVLRYDDEVFAQYRDPSLIAEARGDLKLLRLYPVQCKNVISDWEHLFEAFPGPGWAGEVIDHQLDSIDLKLLRHDSTASFDVRAEFQRPLPVTRAYPRPALPDSCFARFDYCFSSREEIKKSISAYTEFTARHYVPPPGAQVNVEETLRPFNEMMTTLLGEATSVGIERTGKGLVVYAVMQFEEPGDFNVRLTELGKRLRQILKSNADNVPGNRLDYDDGGLHVIRLLTADRKWYSEFIQQGNKVFAVFSQDADHHVAALANLKPGGEAMHLAHASCKLSELKRFLSLIPAERIPPLVRKLMDDRISDGVLGFDLEIKGQTANIELQLPFAMLIPALKLTPF